MKRCLVLTVLLPLAFTFGCKIETPKPVEIPTKPAVEKPATSHSACVGPVAEAKAETVKIGAAEWEIAGSTIRQKVAANAGSLTIGAITDIMKTRTRTRRTSRLWSIGSRRKRLI
jgi:hypothetical protein